MTANEKKLRHVLAKTMERLQIAAAICYAAERENVCDTLAADTWRLKGRIVDGDIQHPFHEAIDQYLVDQTQLDAAKERVKEFVKREADLFDAGDR